MCGNCGNGIVEEGEACDPGADPEMFCDYGDSACAIPPHSLSPKIVREIERQTHELALALKVRLTGAV